MVKKSKTKASASKPGAARHSHGRRERRGAETRESLFRAALDYLAKAGNGGTPRRKYHLAMAYAKAGNIDRGKTTLNAALKINPNVPEAKIAQEVVGVAR